MNIDDKNNSDLNNMDLNSEKYNSILCDQGELFNNQRNEHKDNSQGYCEFKISSLCF